MATTAAFEWMSMRPRSILWIAAQPPRFDKAAVSYSGTRRELMARFGYVGIRVIDDARVNFNQLP
jgi:hypothetical protein